MYPRREEIGNRRAEIARSILETSCVLIRLKLQSVVRVANATPLRSAGSSNSKGLTIPSGPRSTTRSFLRFAFPAREAFLDSGNLSTRPARHEIKSHGKSSHFANRAFSTWCQKILYVHNFRIISSDPIPNFLSPYRYLKWLLYSIFYCRNCLFMLCCVQLKNGTTEMTYYELHQLAISIDDAEELIELPH